MLDTLLTYTQLSLNQIIFAFVCCFFAGVVRGFAGFALSALVMSSLVVILPPVELLPICYVMELVAGLLMSRANIKLANMSILGWLIAGSIIGVPVGTYATVNLPVDTSRAIVLSVIIALAFAQLLVKSPKMKPMASFSFSIGITAGIITGLAHIGGMVIALFMLSQNLNPTATRATLVLFLMAGSLTTGFSLFFFNIFDSQSLWRALLLTPAVIAGVVIGSFLFNPTLQRYYRTFCLVLLIGIASASFVGMLMRVA